MAEEVGKGVVSIEADTKGLGKDIGDKINKESGGLSKIFSSIGHTAGAAFKAAAVAGIAGIAAGAAFAKGAVDAASDLSESMSKVNVVFGEASKDVVDWSKTSAKAFGQSQQSALEAAGTYGNLFQAFGVGQKPAQEMSQTLVELAADLASFNNTSVDEALDALRSGLSGETEPLKRYGVAINEVRLKEQALAMGLIKSTKDALTPAAKAQASYALILQDTSLAQGDFERTSDGLANQQRILSAQWTDMKAKVGKFLLPAFTAIVSFLSTSLLPALPKVAKAFGLLFGADGAYGFAEVMDNVFGNSGKLIPIFEKFGTIVRGVFFGLKAAALAVAKFIADNWDTIKAVVANIVTAAQEAFVAISTAVMWVIDHKPVLIGVLAGIGAAVVTMFTMWAISAATAAAATLAAAAPFIAIGVAVAAVVAAVVYAYTEWEWFRTVVDGVRDWFVNTFWPGLQAVFGWLRDNVPPIIQAIAGFITDTFIPALQGIYKWMSDYVFPVVQKLAEFFVAYWTVAFEIAKVAVETVITVVTTLWGWLQTLWDRSEGLRSFLADAFRVAWEITTTSIGLLKDALVGVYDWFQFVWDKTEGLRGFLTGAFATGVGVARDVIIDVKNALLGAWEWLQNLWDKAEPVRAFLAGAFKTAVDGIKASVDFLAGAFDSVVNAIQWVIDKANAALGPLRELVDLANKIPFVGGGGSGGDKSGGVLPKPRASGGPVVAGRSYVVGEGGWELFRPSTSGTILSHEDSVAAMKAGRMVEFTGPINLYDATDIDGFARAMNFALAGA